MNYPTRAKITALGTYVPPRLLTNQDLEKMVETTDQWILDRTGIKTRHIVDKGVATSDLAVEAAKKALAQRGIPVSDLELIVVATVTPDMFFPSTACLVQHKLGASVWGFDVSAACSAFIYALQCGTQYIATGSHKKVLVIGSDVMSSIIDYTDRATCVLFGDGAGALLLEPAAPGEDAGIIDFVHEVDGSGGCSLYMPGGGSLNPSTHETVDKKMHYVHQDGQAVFKFAVRKMADICQRLLERNGVKGEEIDAFIPHQANKRIIEATAQRMNMRPEAVILNIQDYGNTTAGTIPLAMQTAIERGQLKKGSLVLLAAVGAGFTAGATLLRWAF